MGSEARRISDAEDVASRECDPIIPGFIALRPNIKSFFWFWRIQYADLQEGGQDALAAAGATILLSWLSLRAFFHGFQQFVEGLGEEADPVVGQLVGDFFHRNPDLGRGFHGSI